MIEKYGVPMDFAAHGVHDGAERAVFAVDEDGRVAYEWVSDDPGVEPGYGEVEEAAREAASASA